MSEADLALNDERRDAIDRIHARCVSNGVTKASDVVRAIVDQLPREMRPLVEVELKIGGRHADR